MFVLQKTMSAFYSTKQLDYKLQPNFTSSNEKNHFTILHYTFKLLHSR